MSLMKTSIVWHKLAKRCIQFVINLFAIKFHKIKKTSFFFFLKLFIWLTITTDGVCYFPLLFKLKWQYILYMHLISKCCSPTSLLSGVLFIIYRTTEVLQKSFWTSCIAFQIWNQSKYITLAPNAFLSLKD